eukprot:scaffold5837_cov123-Skeletonema_marinoi.AAC.4
MPPVPASVGSLRQRGPVSHTTKQQAKNGELNGSSLDGVSAVNTMYGCWPVELFSTPYVA